MPNTHATLTSLFSDIADEIRAKTGGSGTIKADDFPAAISQISGGVQGGYTITFEVNSSEYYVASCLQGDTISEPPIPPAPTGYTFWNWQDSNENEIQFPFTPSGDLTLTAVFGQHTELQYLQSTGTQYINTGINAQQPNIRIETQAAFVQRNNNTFLFGSWRESGANSRYALFTSNYDNQVYFYTGNSGYPAISIPDISSARIWATDDNKLYLDGELILTGGDQSFSGLPIYLFGNNNDGTFAQGASAKVYYFKIYIDNVLVRDLIPVLKNGTTPCMFDKVSKQYFYNKGTGDFLYG